MKKIYLLVAAILITISVFVYGFTTTSNTATCTGAKNCKACKNCKYCKHCAKDGGTCGVCSKK